MQDNGVDGARGQCVQTSTWPQLSWWQGRHRSCWCCILVLRGGKAAECFDGSWLRGQAPPMHQQTMRWLECLSKLREVLMDREVWSAAVNGVAKSRA